MLLLWAGNMVINQVEFSYETPAHKTLHLNAKNIHGHKKIIVDDVKGTYGHWFFKARRLVLDTIAHTVNFKDRMYLTSPSDDLTITAPSGAFDLRTYNAKAIQAQLQHRNLHFTCHKAFYDHKARKIICRNGALYSHK